MTRVPLPASLLQRLVRAVPQALTRKIKDLRRDLAVLTGAFSGNHPAPVIVRTRRTPRSSSLVATRHVRVKSVVHDTADALCVELEDPTGAPFSFVPGQFFTVVLPLEGETLRRAYSASSACQSPATVRITVKRVAGGKVSNYIVDSLREGAFLELLGPSGNFVVAPNPGAQRSLVLIAGGSGITPMMSILQSVLPVEPETQVTLLYGNRGEADIIFRKALADLAAGEPRFVLRHVLSNPPDGWNGAAGVLDEATTSRELALLGNLPETTEYYVCGPQPMMDAARAALRSRGVDPEKIHEERFSSPHLRPAAHKITTPQPLTVRCGARETITTVGPDQTLLEAGLAAGAAMKFSCTLGGCAACKVKVVSGEVAMEEPNCLSSDERNEGFVLACVARANSPVVVEVL
ncbi:MAG: ferredoxin--NADP reductase [Myxococcales bacterium]